MRSLRAVRQNRWVAAAAHLYYAWRTRAVERFIFTATTGRTGTLTLTRIFAGIPGCRALHEPGPPMNGEVLRAASYGDTDRVDRAYRAKSINIMRAAYGYRYYLEANHLFVKTFVAHAVRDFGNRLAVIHLVRHPIDVAMSIYRLQQWPGTDTANVWWLDYHAPLNRIQVADALESELSHPYYKALWYWFEVETRIRELQQKLPGVRFIRFQTEWLNDSERVFALAHDLGVPVDRRLADSLVGVKDNVREHGKSISPLPAVKAHRMLEHFTRLISQRYPDAVAYTP